MIFTTTTRTESLISAIARFAGKPLVTTDKTKFLQERTSGDTFVPLGEHIIHEVDLTPQDERDYVLHKLRQGFGRPLPVLFAENANIELGDL